MKSDNTRNVIVKEMCRAIPTYIDFVRCGGVINRDYWLEKVMEQLPDQESADAIIPLVLERIDKVAFRYQKKWMVSQVYNVKAEQIIVPELESHGFEAKACYWEGSAIVTVRLSGKMCIQLFIPYRELGGKGCLDQLISDIAELKRVVGQLGNTLVRAGIIIRPSLRRKLIEHRGFSKEAGDLKIIKASVKTYVAPAFKSAGFVPNVLYLEDQALITVYLAPRMRAYFKVPYDDLHDEAAFQEMASGAIALRDIVTRIGRGMIVANMDSHMKA